MVSELIGVLIVSLLVQQIVDVVKKAIKFNTGYAYLNKKVNLKVVLSIIVSVSVCVSSNICIFSLLGVNVLPLIDSILTGFIVAGGSSGIQNLIKKMNTSYKNFFTIFTFFVYFDFDEIIHTNHQSYFYINIIFIFINNILYKIKKENAN